jgi:hypothetical protein
VDQRLAEGSRCLAHAIASSKHTCENAYGHGRDLRRSPLKLCMMPRKPWFSSPIRLAAGTRQSSKYSVAVSEHHQPIFSSGVRGEARRVALDHQQRHAAHAFATGAHGHGDVVGAHARGDERLAAVDHVVVALATRGGAEVRHVRAAVGLGDRQRGDRLAAQHRRHDALP